MAGENLASTPNPPSALAAALLLVREHGLIVLALFALMWQAWFVSTNAQIQQAAWRATVNDTQRAIMDDQRQRTENLQKLTEALSKIYETMHTAQTIIADMEEECLVENLKKQLKESKTQ